MFICSQRSNPLPRPDGRDRAWSSPCSARRPVEATPHGFIKPDLLMLQGEFANGDGYQSNTRPPVRIALVLPLDAKLQLGRDRSDSSCDDTRAPRCALA